MQMIVAMEFDGEKYEDIHMALGLVEKMSNAYDAISRNVRSVHGAPLFSDGAVKMLQKEIQSNDEQ